MRCCARSICIVQIQPRKHVILIYHVLVCYTVPTRQHWVRSYRSGTYLSALKDLDHQLGIEDLSDTSKHQVCQDIKRHQYFCDPLMIFGTAKKQTRWAKVGIRGRCSNRYFHWSFLFLSSCKRGKYQLQQIHTSIPQHSTPVLQCTKPPKATRHPWRHHYIKTRARYPVRQYEDSASRHQHGHCIKTRRHHQTRHGYIKTWQTYENAKTPQRLR